MDIKAVIFPFFIQKSQEIELRSNRIGMLDELVRYAHHPVNSDNRQVFLVLQFILALPLKSRHRFHTLGADTFLDQHFLHCQKQYLHIQKK